MHTKKQFFRAVCDVIAYHLVHFFSIWVIHKCQSGIDFFTSVRAVKLQFYEKIILMTSQVFSRNNMEMKLAMCILAININKGARIASEV